MCPHPGQPRQGGQKAPEDRLVNVARAVSAAGTEESGEGC